MAQLRAKLLRLKHIRGQVSAADTAWEILKIRLGHDLRNPFDALVVRGKLLRFNGFAHHGEAPTFERVRRIWSIDWLEACSMALFSCEWLQPIGCFVVFIWIG